MDFWLIGTIIWTVFIGYLWIRHNVWFTSIDDTFYLFVVVGAWVLYGIHLVADVWNSLFYGQSEYQYLTGGLLVAFVFFAGYILFLRKR